MTAEALAQMPKWKRNTEEEGRTILTMHFSIFKLIKNLRTCGVFLNLILIN